ncbi:MAG: S41 family peptidase [Candidatus Melainabacteria bacterium]|nr:S41 family peptidase [Candidatus Melainabacteria bacterium]
MHYKNDTKNYLKFNLLTFLVLFLFSSATIFGEKVSADFGDPKAYEVYNVAWNTINEKFYFKSKINLDRWQNKFSNKINDLNDAHKYINKLVKELKDPYTRFLTKEEFKDEQNIMNSTLIGIGVKLGSKNPFIIDILTNSPAYAGGLKPNDYILSVNDKSTFGLSSSQVANLIRGPKDSSLTIKIKRHDEIITKTLIRKEFNFKTVSTELLDNDIALVKIDSFIPENTSKAFKDELLKLMSANGLILDLRNNSGGLVKNAVEIADMFLSEGKIVSTINNLAKVNEYANSSQLYDSNIIILVNENTASASEILTGALKENQRAIVIGKRTFGKGLVQEIVKLPDDSALHVTIGAYLTPSGKSLNKIGLIPDEIVLNENKQLERAKEILLTLKSNKEKARLASL